MFLALATVSARCPSFWYFVAIATVWMLFSSQLLPFGFLQRVPPKLVISFAFRRLDVFFFLAPATVDCFSSLATVWMFPRATFSMFPCACYCLNIFPGFLLFWCLCALATSSMFPRACYCLDVFPRFLVVLMFSRLLHSGCLLALASVWRFFLRFLLFERFLDRKSVV